MVQGRWVLDGEKLLADDTDLAVSIVIASFIAVAVTYMDLATAAAFISVAKEVLHDAFVAASVRKGYGVQEGRVVLLVISGIDVHLHIHCVGANRLLPGRRQC